MIAFFDKYRVDRKLEEALQLASQIESAEVGSRLKAVLSLHFVEAPFGIDVLDRIVGHTTGGSNIENDSRTISSLEMKSPIPVDPIPIEKPAVAA
jgi:hypothetical protein